ncbi:unnamed protein product [Meloidogyne enterolobii]|uniref:Uncharacterized protein n=1 Tax=Meloidogyne enterolobii TaxID=390850 RepID=A0ACB0ZG63_MELEN
MFYLDVSAMFGNVFRKVVRNVLFRCFCCVCECFPECLICNVLFRCSEFLETFKMFSGNLFKMLCLECFLEACF